MLIETVGNTVTVGFSVGSWYTGKSNFFNGEIYNTNSRLQKPIISSFYEISPGEYAVDVTPTVGTYVVYISNSEIFEGSISKIIKIEPNTLDIVDTNVLSIKSAVNNLPILSDIEGSTIIAKSSDISVVEAIVSNHPTLQEFRNELINVTFGGLEIVNNQLILKDKTGIVIAIFDLFDKNGNPTMLSVYKRTVVQ